MKIFLFIFSFYILALACVPCSDREDCREHEVASHETDHGSHANDEDHCSPFCTCSCCGLVCISTSLLNIDFAVAKATWFTYDAPTNSKGYSCYFHTFWQPPKLKA